MSAFTRLEKEGKVGSPLAEPIPVTIELRVKDRDQVPVGAPIVVQIRDTTFQDAPAETLAEARGTVVQSGERTVAIINLILKRFARETSIWAHIDVDEDGRVSRGDYLTTQAYPLPENFGRTVQVMLKKI